MTNKKSTKRALLFSVLSLVLCFSMLVGTTFAWFTDSVTSGNNVIISGNLDVELEYWNGTEWADVEGMSDILTNNLWEPGVVEVAYLRVANAGSLALKYQLGININSETEGKNAAGETFKLSDYIMFGVVENVNGQTGAYANRAEAVAAVTDAKKISAGYTKAASMIAGTELYLALVVWMPEDVGNVANHDGINKPQIDLGINIVATQTEAESDAFAPDYDKDAWVDGMAVMSAADLQAAINNGVTDITLAADITLDEPIVIPAPAAATYSLRSTPVTINLNGKTITAAYDESTNKHAYAIDNYGNLVINGGSIKARGIYNQNGATITVNGTEIVNLDMNGGSCIWGYDGAIYLNDAKLIGYTGCVYSQGYLEINGGTYTCYSAITDDGNQLTPTYNIRSYGDLVINDGEFTSRHGLLAINGSAEINGGTYTMTSIGVITSHVFYTNGDSAEVVVNGGTFNCDLRTAQNNGSSMICNNAVKSTINVFGGVFNLTPEKYVAEGFKAVETPNGYMVISSDSNYVADGVLVSTDGKTYYISNRAGYEWVESQADNFFGNKTIALTNDIDFGGDTIPSIGFWNSHPTFDGQGHTLSNLTVAQTGMNSSSGLFAGTFNVKNLNVDKASVKGTYAGVISGWMYGNIDNCTVKNSTVNNTFWQGGGLVAQYNSGNVTNCTVENCTISGGSAVGGLIGILNETAGERKVENCTVKNCTISMNGGFGGDYDKYFGVAVGLINVENSTVYFNNCTLEQNTLKGVESDMIYGEAESGTKVFVNGATAVHNVAELQAALDNNVANIVFDADINGDVTFTQVNGVSLVIDGNDKVMNGSINIIARANTSDTATIVIKNINFKTADTERVFIHSNETNRYPNNVTVSGCTFEGAGADSNVVAINIKSSNNFVIENCTATKVHSLIQNTSGWNLTIKNVTVTEAGRGMALGTVQGVTLEKVTVDCAKYGIRMDAGYNNNAVITDCNVKAFIPVVVRKVSVASNVTFNGTNTMVETNTDGLWCAIGSSEYEANGTMPTAASATVTVTLNDAGLDVNGVYNNSSK